MPYVMRDAKGRIKAIYDKPRKDAKEKLPAGHKEITSFLAEGEGDEKATQSLASQSLQETDESMVRISEDLVSVLVRKKLIKFTDLPESAQKKLMNRSQLRNQLDKFDVSLIVDRDVL